MTPPDPRPRRRLRALGYVAGWVLAATVAVSVGVIAVSSVGASLRDRGPTVNEAIAQANRTDAGDGRLVPPAGAEKVRSEITDEFGAFVVECQGVVATGVSADPVDGWRTVSFESGPDDDVDAVFAQGDRSIEVEVFCNRGEPTVSDLERNELPDLEDD